MYILINNPQCSPPQSVELKTSFTPPFRATAASTTKSKGITVRLTVSLCTVLREKSEFFLQGPGERRASQITPYQFISSRCRDLLHCLLCGGAGQPGSGKIHRSRAAINAQRSAGQSALPHRREYCFTEASFGLRERRGFHIYAILKSSLKSQGWWWWWRLCVQVRRFGPRFRNSICN